jgi:hypothetical protein
MLGTHSSLKILMIIISVKSVGTDCLEKLSQGKGRTAFWRKRTRNISKVQSHRYRPGMATLKLGTK